MPKIITLASQKGGVGKTTLALNLWSAYESLAPVLVDLDNQQSLKQLKEATGLEFSLLPYTSASALMDTTAPLVLVDTPPYLTQTLSDVLAVSDLVVIPLRPSYLDVLALRPLVELVQRAKETNTKLKAVLVLNMLDTSKLASEVMPHVATFGLTIANTTIKQRASYARGALAGGVHTQNDPKAVTEINALASELFGYMGK